MAPYSLFPMDVVHMVIPCISTQPQLPAGLKPMGTWASGGSDGLRAGHGRSWQVMEGHGRAGGNPGDLAALLEGISFGPFALCRIACIRDLVQCLFRTRY